MLIQFRFSNYKSFRDETSLDLSATKVTEHPHHITEIGKEKVLKASAIYGANASGKTNIYAAFRYMAYYVLHSFGFGGENTVDKSHDYKKPDSFLFDTKSKQHASLFEVYFIDKNDGRTYNYGFCVTKEGITEEWLNSKAKTTREYISIFYRENNRELNLQKLPKKLQENIKISLNKETLIVSLGAKLKVDILEKIYNWFSQITFLNFGDPVENFLLSKQLPSDFSEKPEVRKDVASYLASFDKSIVDFAVEEVNSDDDESDKRFKVWAIHKTNDTDEPVNLPLSLESAGTQKMFSMYSPLQKTLSSGSVLFIDELNARLHPLLTRNFIQTFLDPERNPNSAQIIFTTHDTSQLENSLLRRDEIWFVEKDDDETSKLYSLVDFKGEDNGKIRKDENYAKNYLQGKYGGIPNLQIIKTEEVKKHAA